MTAPDLTDAVLWRVLRACGLEPAGDRRGLADRRAAREWRDRLFETIAENDDEMMELYLNVIEFGPNLYGIGAAADLDADLGGVAVQVGDQHRLDDLGAALHRDQVPLHAGQPRDVINGGFGRGLGARGRGFHSFMAAENYRARSRQRTLREINNS